jgi:hypothetical protein
MAKFVNVLRRDSKSTRMQLGHNWPSVSTKIQSRKRRLNWLLVYVYEGKGKLVANAHCSCLHEHKTKKRYFTASVVLVSQALARTYAAHILSHRGKGNPRAAMPTEMVCGEQSPCQSDRTMKSSGTSTTAASSTLIKGSPLFVRTPSSSDVPVAEIRSFNSPDTSAESKAIEDLLREQNEIASFLASVR